MALVSGRNIDRARHDALLARHTRHSPPATRRVAIGTIKKRRSPVSGDRHTAGTFASADPRVTISAAVPISSRLPSGRLRSTGRVSESTAVEPVARERHGHFAIRNALACLAGRRTARLATLATDGRHVITIPRDGDATLPARLPRFAWPTTRAPFPFRVRPAHPCWRSHADARDPLTRTRVGFFRSYAPRLSGRSLLRVLRRTRDLGTVSRPAQHALTSPHLQALDRGVRGRENSVPRLRLNGRKHRAGRRTAPAYIPPMPLLVRFLGTAASRPTVERGVSSLALIREGETILVDCGEGTQRQMMRYGVSFAFEDLFFTHIHADHFLGLTGLIRTLQLQGRTEPLRLWGPPGSAKNVAVMHQLGWRTHHVSRSRLPSWSRAHPVKRNGLPDRDVSGRSRQTACIGIALVEDDRLGPLQSGTRAGAGDPRGPAVGTHPQGRADSPSTTAA